MFYSLKIGVVFYCLTNYDAARKGLDNEISVIERGLDECVQNVDAVEQVSTKWRQVAEEIEEGVTQAEG